MSRLLGEIRRSSKAAADVLEKAGLRSDADIQLLTREELHELFPEHKNFKLRRTIFDIIHKQKPIDVILRELKEFIPHESFRTALTNNGVLVDYLHILKDIKTQINNVQNFLDAHIAILEEFSKNPPDQEPVSCNPVKLPSGQPDGHSQGARGTGTSDTSGQMMLHTGQTGGHLQGPQMLGRNFYVHLAGKTNGAHQAFVEKFKDVGQIEVQSPEKSDYLLVFCPITSRVEMDISKALDNIPGGKPAILVVMHHTFSPDYVVARSMRQVNHSGILLTVDCLFYEHNLLKCNRNDNAWYDVQKFLGISFSQVSTWNTLVRSSTLKYKMIVGGKTFGAHQQLMEKVQDQVQDQVRLIESSQDYKLTFVFCPISSRVASDVEAAMTDVTDDTPVILVLMHHTREVKYTTSMRTWPDYANVVLHVNVFYHETVRGLLKDQQNDPAVTQIQNKLLECFVPKSEYSSGNAQGGDAASGLPFSTSVRGGGNNRASETDGYSGVSTQKGGKNRWWLLS